MQIQAKAGSIFWELIIAFLNLVLSLHFDGHFPGKPGLASFIEAKDEEMVVDDWSYNTFKVPVKSSSSTNQHQTIYSPSVAQPTMSKHHVSLTDNQFHV